MKISRFVNNPDETPLHSSGLSGDGAPAPQSFTERQQLEKQRSLIKGYRQSLVGSTFAQRGRISPRQRPAVTPPGSDAPPSSRQQFNAGDRGFTEPPTRGYNPYS